MPAKKHKPEEIIGKLREVEIVLGQGGTTAEACRRISVSEQTYYRWRKEYGGLKTDQVKRLKDLEIVPRRRSELAARVLNVVLALLLLLVVALSAGCRKEDAEKKVVKGECFGNISGMGKTIAKASFAAYYGQRSPGQLVSALNPVTAANIRFPWTDTNDDTFVQPN